MEGETQRENKRMCSRCCCCGALYCIAPPSELSSLFCGPRCYYDTATEEGESRLLCAGRGDVTSQQLVHGHMRFEASSNDDVGSFTCSVQHPKWNFVLSFSLFLFFMKGRTKGIIKEQQAKGNLEHFFSFSSFFFFSFCKVHYILVVQSQRYKLYIIERLLLALDGRQM